MSIAETLIDISYESKLNRAEKVALRRIAKEVRDQTKLIKALEARSASVVCPKCKTIIKTV